jgi:hypothetical protein
MQNRLEEICDTATQCHPRDWVFCRIAKFCAVMDLPKMHVLVGYLQTVNASRSQGRRFDVKDGRAMWNRSFQRRFR